MYVTYEISSADLQLWLPLEDVSHEMDLAFETTVASGNHEIAACE